MYKFKSHFVFSTKQRRGIFLLLILVVSLQCVYFFIDFPQENVSIDQETLDAYQKEIDALYLAKSLDKKPKIYPFNPNYITDYKGARLGMSVAQIDRLLHFRAQGKWINSKQQFKKVTGVPDSLLNTMAPLFKFPDWVLKANSKKNKIKNHISLNKPHKNKQDLNTATALQLEAVYGVGRVLAKRILKYRDITLGGFASIKELKGVYGLKPETIANINKLFLIKTPRPIVKLNINTATKDELVTVTYIDYEIAHHIIEYRQLRSGFKSLSELTKVKDFPVNKIEIIELYLYID